MPSYVAFTETGRLVGSAAKSQAGINPENTVSDALRFIGRKLSDPEVQAMIKNLPFHVTERRGRPTFVDQHRGIELVLTPVEILAMILARAKRNAQNYLGKERPVTVAVIAVPANLNFCQREAIWDAALIAKLCPLRLINAPTTACSDYVITHQSVGERNVLITNFDAGTCDVSLATVEEGILEIKAAAGDTCPGGEDFDSRLVRYAADIFTRKTSFDPTINSRALRRLHTALKRRSASYPRKSRPALGSTSYMKDTILHGLLHGKSWKTLASTCFMVYSSLFNGL